MAVAWTRQELEELNRVWRAAIREIAEAVEDGSVGSRLRTLGLLALLERVVGRLERSSAAWVKKSVTNLYDENIRGVSREVGARRARAGDWRAAHGRLIEQLEAEILGRLTAVTRQVRDNLRIFVLGLAAARGLRRPPLSARDARRALGVLRGRTEPEALAALGTLARVADAVYVGAARRTYAPDYVGVLARTHGYRVANEATAARARELQIEHVMISPNAPLKDDICSLYFGRIFSLSPEAEKRTGYPELARVPGGGPPFHPNCRHFLVPFRLELATDAELEAAEAHGPGRIPHEKGVPSSALDRSWREVEAWRRSLPAGFVGRWVGG